MASRINDRARGRRSTIGAIVQYCGHDGVFSADLLEIEGAVVVRTNGPVTPGNIERPAAAHKPTHHLVESYTSGQFWRPDLGVFVVPKASVRAL